MSRQIVIVGAGPGGLGLAVKLKAAGFDDITIVEKADGVGGTWRHNRYPGCACDVPSHLYSFSFAPNPHWTRPYADQPEILAYLERCADDFDLRRHCRFDAEVETAQWSDHDSRWTLTLADGDRLDADILVSAVGMFNEPSWPDIAGREAFGGTSLHTARWQPDLDLAGRAVGVIGSAASAVQLVPEIAETADNVYLFQRTANWVLPKADTPFTAQQLAHFAGNPDVVAALRETIYAGFEVGSTFSNLAVRAEREADGLANIELVADPEVRAKLRPDHAFGCKRPLFSNRYYPAFNRKNLELVTDAIDYVSVDAIVTADGKCRRVDTIVYATGFATTKYLSVIDVVGRDGLRLRDVWAQGPEAYLGIATVGFPNLFMLYGPNTNNGSIITMLEHQFDHIVAQVQRLDDPGVASIEVRAEIMAEFNAALQADLDGVEVWNSGCSDYYRGPNGRIVTQWPLSMSDYGRRTAAPAVDAYVTR